MNATRRARSWRAASSRWTGESPGTYCPNGTGTAHGYHPPRARGERSPRSLAGSSVNGAADRSPRSRASSCAASTSGAPSPAAASGDGVGEQLRRRARERRAPVARARATRSASPRNSSASCVTTTTPARSRAPLARRAEHRRAARRVEARGRLVEQQVARAHREHARDRGTARLAARQRERRAVGRTPSGSSPTARQRLARAPRRSSSAAPRLRGPNATSSSDRLGEELRLGVLEDEPDAPRARVARGQRLAVDRRHAPQSARAARPRGAAASTCPTRSRPSTSTSSPGSTVERHAVERALRVARCPRRRRSRRRRGSAPQRLHERLGVDAPRRARRRRAPRSSAASTRQRRQLETPRCEQLRVARAARRRRRRTRRAPRRARPRGPPRATSARSWVTCSDAVPVDARAAARRASTSARPRGSSIDVGSSSTRYAGRIASAPAMASRCFWPPRAGAARGARSPVEPDRGERLVDARADLARAARRGSRDRTRRPPRRPSPTIWSSGFWKTSPTRSRTSQTRALVARVDAVDASPCPTSGSSSPLASRASVDLPEPFAPSTRDASRPGATSSETPRSARRAAPAR